mmetsp:Transcript_93014/g.300771  ORF Transcript_93014/g.300771 Transcript_93014/m.300771 type:complete len:313 (+) Transcript_93014:306-1244(+)
MPAPLARGFAWAKDSWSLRQVQRQCRGKLGPALDLMSKSRRDSSIQLLMTGDLSKAIRPWQQIVSGQYYAAAMLVNRHLTARLCQFYPGVFRGPLSRFGLFHDTFNAFMRTRPDPAVTKIADRRSWRAGGPLIGIPIRKVGGQWMRWHTQCLSKVLRQLGLQEARVFVTCIATVVRTDFQKIFGIVDGLGTNRTLLPAGTFEFKFSGAMDENGAGKVKDRKSPSAHVDVLALSAAEILLVDPRTTFGNTAHALGLPRRLYVHVPRSESCVELDYRDACFHNLKHVMMKHGPRNVSHRAAAYFESCLLLGAGD